MGLDLGSWQVSPIEPGGRHFHALVSSPPSLPQQFSPASLPAELLAPLTYISLVGCSISIVASLLTLLLHFHARYAPVPGLPATAAQHFSFVPASPPRVGWVSPEGGGRKAGDQPYRVAAGGSLPASTCVPVTVCL